MSEVVLPVGFSFSDGGISLIIDSGSPEYDEVDEGDEDHVESGDQDVEESYGVVDGQVHVDARLEEVGPVFFRLDSIGAVMMNILVFLQSPEFNYHDHDGNVHEFTCDCPVMQT